MRGAISFATSLLLIVCCSINNAFDLPAVRRIASRTTTVGYRPSLVSPPQPPFNHGIFTELSSYLAASSSLASSDGDGTLSRPDQIKIDGGSLAFRTKYGALNPYAICYGLTSILLGLPWFLVLNVCRFFSFISRGKMDRRKRVPIFFSQCWGEALLRLTGCYPTIEGRHILRKFYKENRSAMFVGNHNSWMDIPFMGATIGWRNYKMISKQELVKVPILRTSIIAGGHVLVDRTNRKSQLSTLKNGMQWLREGVHLCTFPEGTRSKTGRLLPFKNGAFKMAHKMGAPVIPLTIIGSGKAHPYYWMFPCRPCRNVCKVVVHEPIESKDKTEGELAQAVRDAIIKGLPEDQKPLN